MQMMNEGSDTTEQELYNSLALAVVRQAIEDWHYLCQGGEEVAGCNFTELTIFFRDHADKYLACTDITAERIFKKLKRERGMR